MGHGIATQLNDSNVGRTGAARSPLRTTSALASLEPLFKARSLAIVGASANPSKLGHATLRSLLDGGYDGAVYPVNPSAAEILGIRAYPSVSEIPENIDLVVLVVPAEATPPILEEAASKGARAAIVLSAGFGEAGRPDLELELLRVARATGVRVLGPNIQGLSYLPNKLNAVFWPSLTLQGPLGIIGQSGSVSAALAEWAEADGLGVSAMVNLGNQLDVADWEVLSFLADDAGTKGIAVYLECPKDGRRFFEIARDIARDLPIAILKPGRTVGGQRAALSHTGSLAGHDRVFDAACRQYGLVRAYDVTTLYDVSKAMTLLGDIPGDRLLVVSTSGGCGALAADEACSRGLSLPPVSPEFLDALSSMGLSANSQECNPVDFPIVDPAVVCALLRTAHRLGSFDGFVLSLGDPVLGLAVELERLPHDLLERLCVSYMGGGDVERSERVPIQRLGVPVFPTPERASRAMAAAVWATRWRGNAR